MLVVLIATFVGCQRPLYREYRIPNTSMEPTFARHEKVTVRVVGPDVELQRGDIVVFRQPENEEKLYMKRVVAVAGDSVEIKPDGLSINGTMQVESYARYTRALRAMQAMTVPPGSVFVLGDNRSNSLDSRHYGCVPLDNVVGLLPR